MTTKTLISMAALTAVAFVTSPANGQWGQFGGPAQDFKASCGTLATEWPDEGPKQLWSRDLCEGYSGIVIDGDVLYTMGREGDKETVLAINAKDGKTIWQQGYESPPREGHVREFGEGPRGTPTIDGDRIYTIGVSGKMHCLNKKDGEILWSHDLWEEYKGNFLNHGYSSSVFAYGDTAIALVGGKGHSIVAFDKKTGKEVWKGLDFDNSYSSPKLIKVDGEEHLVCFMASEVVAINPKNGKLLWSFEHKNRWGQNICQPIIGDDHMVFITSVDTAGSKGLKLSKKDGKFEVEEVWANRKVAVHHSNAIRVGDYIYTSTGGQGPGLFFAVNAKTGDMAYRKRGFSKATLLMAGDKFLLLDEDGKLGLVEATPEKFDILAQAKVLDRVSWTVPTLVGTKLYLRDKKKLVALELGSKAYATAAGGAKAAS
ncbi:hypothetical protein B7486_15615 [cyanobacterium TDX16]|nr:hypothetical protein B7486_15615 [cyanobacterium TDX16]